MAKANVDFLLQLFWAFGFGVWTILAILSYIFFAIHCMLERACAVFPYRNDDLGCLSRLAVCRPPESKSHVTLGPVRGEQEAADDSRAGSLQPDVRDQKVNVGSTAKGDRVHLKSEAGVGKLQADVGPFKVDVASTAKADRHVELKSEAGVVKGGPYGRVEGAMMRVPRMRSIALPYNCHLGVSTPKKWYAIAKGRSPGIYRTWEEAEAQVTGFSGANHKSFRSHSEAETWLQRQFNAMGAQWKAPNIADGHRVNVQLLGLDESGHEVFKCDCCEEIFCSNEH